MFKDKILQNIKSGELQLEEVPSFASSNGMVQVRTHTSLISAGTEKMVLNFANNVRRIKF